MTMGQGKATDEQLAKIEEYRNSYVEMVGFVPPRIASRIARLTELNPDFLIAQEEVRRQAVYTDALDQKTVQLILFAVLAVNVRDAAKLHGLAALRAGATWEELQATTRAWNSSPPFTGCTRSPAAASRCTCGPGKTTT